MRGPCGLERSFSTIDAWIPFIHSHSTRFSDLYKTSNRRDVVRNHLEKAQVQAFCSPERHVILARAALVALATNSAATTGTGGASCGRYLKCQAFKKISASREVFSRTGSYSKAESSLGHQAPHRAATTPYRTIGHRCASFRFACVQLVPGKQNSELTSVEPQQRQCLTWSWLKAMSRGL